MLPTSIPGKQMTTKALEVEQNATDFLAMHPGSRSMAMVTRAREVFGVELTDTASFRSKGKKSKK